MSYEIFDTLKVVINRLSSLSMTGLCIIKTALSLNGVVDRMSLNFSTMN